MTAEKEIKKLRHCQYQVRKALKERVTEEKIQGISSRDAMRSEVFVKQKVHDGTYEGVEAESYRNVRNDPGKILTVSGGMRRIKT